jgi:hypothetical protein
MEVRICHIDTDKTYIAKNKKDCLDELDKSVYDEVVRLQTVITMGKVIGYIQSN